MALLIDRDHIKKCLVKITARVLGIPKGKEILPKWENEAIRVVLKSHGKLFKMQIREPQNS